MSVPDFHIRQFLNDKHGKAHIEITASLSEDREDIDAVVDISDCSRSISLDFGTFAFMDSEDNSVEQRLAKLDRIINNLTALKSWYRAAARETGKELD